MGRIESLEEGSVHGPMPSTLGMHAWPPPSHARKRLLVRMLLLHAGTCRLLLEPPAVGSSNEQSSCGSVTGQLAGAARGKGDGGNLRRQGGKRGQIAGGIR